MFLGNWNSTPKEELLTVARDGKSYSFVKVFVLTSLVVIIPLVTVVVPGTITSSVYVPSQSLFHELVGNELAPIGPEVERYGSTKGVFFKSMFGDPTDGYFVPVFALLR